jgi:hypothetical protein
MKYITHLRDNDFDFYLFDSSENLIFCASYVNYIDVSSMQLESNFKHFLVFKSDTFSVNVLIELPVESHLNLLESLRIIND